ncbi:MAG: radical SAM protein [Megasphaera sp.]|nr:radical SAM protein [Megasphaera sp.]MCH4187031.1 radical SAM protein [Megasphaera sp.]MCH4217033.1 radical SAM protein [Megasphaera sp.]
MIKTSIIPIFIPHIGCPHRCVFCNQWQITGHHGIPSADDIQKAVISYTRGVQEKRHWEIAFYGGSFTAVPAALQEKLLEPAQKALEAGLIQRIRCSTRPDCIDRTVMDRLDHYGVTIVELGVQSMDDAVLAKAKRGHTASQVEAATALLRSRGFIVGHQLMPGLPDEDWPSLEKTTAAICRLHPDIARIYPVAVLEHTELAQLYREGKYTPLTVQEGVRRAAYMKQAFIEAHIQVIRTGLQATADLDDDTQVLGGAYTPAMGEMTDALRYRKKIFAVLDAVRPGYITISYNRKDTSRVRGYRKQTMHEAQKKYSFPICWREDNSLPAGTIRVGTSELTMEYHFMPDE